MNAPASTALPTYDEALTRLIDHLPLAEAETVALEQAFGRLLRQDIRADRDQPPFNRSAMDGFALRSGDYQPARTYRVVGRVAAGAAPSDFGAGTSDVIHIATGAAVPETFDAVIPIEQAQVINDSKGESVRFSLNELEPWRNIHRRGADAQLGHILLHPGDKLTPQAIGLAAAVGAAKVRVSRQPRIALLTTGDEVRPPDTPAEALAPHHIRSSNGPMLSALIHAAGAHLVHHAHVRDEWRATLDATRAALADADIVVTVGGVSVGERDLLPRAWAELGLDTLVHGVAIQPGKPVFIAQAPQSACTVIGLPGNPVSVLATAHLFLWPAIRTMLGQGPLPWHTLPLASAVRATAKREVFRAASRTQDGAAEVIPWQGSGDLTHTAQATGWVRLPRQDGDIEPGHRVPFLSMLG